MSKPNPITAAYANECADACRGYMGKTKGPMFGDSLVYFADEVKSLYTENTALKAKSAKAWAEGVEYAAEMSRSRASDEFVVKPFRLIYQRFAEDLSREAGKKRKFWIARLNDEYCEGCKCASCTDVRAQRSQGE